MSRRSEHPQLYGLWKDVRKRARQRGEPFDPQWDDFGVFLDWCLTNGWREGSQLGRRRPERGYSPENCFFGSHSAVCRTNYGRLVTAFGETKSVTDWAEDPRCEASRVTLEARLLEGWTEQRAVETPVRFHDVERR